MPTDLSIKKFFEGKKIKVPVEAVSNGVDLTSFKPGVVPEEIYKKYQIPKNVKIVLYVGRIDPEKRIKVVAEAFRQFLNKHKLDSLSKTLFLVVGDGVAKQDLVNFVHKKHLESSVRVLGKIMPPELNDVYRLGDVFITASEVETQGIVLIEAAASGLPLIAVNSGAVAEVCVDGKNGFLIEPGDVNAMSLAIDGILSDDNLRKTMSKQSIGIAKEHSIERTLDKYLNIYEKLIKGVQK